MLIPGFTAGAQAPAELHTRWSPWRALLGVLAPQQRTGTEKAMTDRTELEAQVAALHGLVFMHLRGDVGGVLD
ncbi:MAG: hypothetical protein E6861_23205, partial [Stenotrophomonas maltophilia]|nr:hypothetical protein [Stenotrophomonas maltophilia]